MLGLACLGRLTRGAILGWLRARAELPSRHRANLSEGPLRPVKSGFRAKIDPTCSRVCDRSSLSDNRCDNLSVTGSPEVASPHGFGHGIGTSSPTRRYPSCVSRRRQSLQRSYSRSVVSTVPRASSIRHPRFGQCRKPNV